MPEQCYVQFFLPGSLFAEEVVRECASPEDVGPVPARAFAFVTYWRTRVRQGGEVLEGPVRCRSPRTYIGGRVYSLEQLRRLPGDNATLIGNIAGNGYWGAIRCRTGNWQPLETEEAVRLCPESSFSYEAAS